jgi:hypothetical protein
MENNPSQIPDSFTLGDHPYGWSGFAMAGPFNGLSTFSSNVHAQNTDSTSEAEVSTALFGIDKEVYLGTLLQNAADPKYRFNPKQTKKPSEFFAKIENQKSFNKIILWEVVITIGLMKPLDLQKKTKKL